MEGCCGGGSRHWFVVVSPDDVAGEGSAAGGARPSRHRQNPARTLPMTLCMQADMAPGAAAPDRDAKWRAASIEPREEFWWVPRRRHGGEGGGQKARMS